MARKRLYKLSYPGDGPVYIEDAGHLLKISGILMQGQDLNLLLLSPTADTFLIQDSKGFNWNHVTMQQPALETWCEILRRTDDPLIFEQDDIGTIKAIVRKQQYAISGAIQQMIWARDKFMCLYCGLKMGKVQLTIDHFIPLELGGPNDQSNYVSACRQCNKRKGKHSPARYCVTHNLDYEGLKLYLAGKAPLGFIAHL